MYDPKLTYLYLMLGTLLFPFLLSFDRKVHFSKRWRYLLPAILIPAAIFLVWDVIFTEKGIWHFSDDYTLGLDPLGLPLEEWMFFLFVPYACVFVYDVIKYYFPGLVYGTAGQWIAGIIMLAGVIFIILNAGKVYTTVVFTILLITLLLQFFLPLAPQYLTRFFVAYLVCLVPFALVNGVLTSLPVVAYNDLENMGIRLFTIPFEDQFYFMTLLLMNVSIYEYLQGRSVVPGSKSEND